MTSAPKIARSRPLLGGRAVLSLLALLMISARASSSSAGEQQPWEQNRSLENFRTLLAHSPFSLPTAEQNSPLTERYALTGIVSVGGVDQIFVFDRTDQSRELVGRKPNSKGMSLVAVMRDSGASPKASISIGGETGTIGFLESSPSAAQPAAAQAAPQPGSPAFQGQTPQPAVQLPALPPLPQQPGSPQQGRRIIRRPVIHAPQPAAPAAPHP